MTGSQSWLELQTVSWLCWPQKSSLQLMPATLALFRSATTNSSVSIGSLVFLLPHSEMVTLQSSAGWKKYTMSWREKADERESCHNRP